MPVKVADILKKHVHLDQCEQETVEQHLHMHPIPTVPLRERHQLNPLLISSFVQTNGYH